MPKITYREKLDQTKNWLQRINIINLFHTLKKVQSPKWRLHHTAKYFGLSMASISQSLNLAKNIELVKDCKSRKEALLIIRKIK